MPIMVTIMPVCVFHVSRWPSIGCPSFGRRNPNGLGLLTRHRKGRPVSLARPKGDAQQEVALDAEAEVDDVAVADD